MRGKKIVAVLLSLLLVVGLVPGTVWASTDEREEWLIAGDASYDEMTGVYTLTEDYLEWQTGAIWYNYPLTNDFYIELDYYTGSKDRELGGADGITVAFYADYDYVMRGGEQLAFTDSKGYGIELDTYCNALTQNDPEYNHIALIKEKTSNHLLEAELLESEDEQWHHLEVEVKDNICTAYVDGNQKLSHEVESTGYDWLGITAATGTGQNLHQVKNISIKIEYTETARPSAYLDVKLSHEKTYDEDGKYQYEITASVTNTAQAMAPNTSIVLTENAVLRRIIGDEIVNFGDIAVGATKTASWTVEADWPEEGTAPNYSVIVFVNGTDVSLYQESYIYLKAKNEHDNTFDFGKDQWRFSNSDYYFDPNCYNYRKEHNGEEGDPNCIEGYYLTEEDMCLLLEGASEIEEFLFRYDIRSHWNGSCYGLSAIAALVKSGVLNLQKFGVTYLYDIKEPIDDSVIESWINFYYVQQDTLKVRNYMNSFALKSNVEQLVFIEEMAKTVSTGGNPIILGINSDHGGHAVVIYDVENKDEVFFWNWGNGCEDYHSRFVIYDCKHPDDPTYLYYNKESGNWIYSANASYKRITLASNDIEILDAINYGNARINQYARIQFESDMDEFYLKRNGETITIDGSTDLREEGIVAYHDSNTLADGSYVKTPLNVVLPSLTEDYTVVPVAGSDSTFTMLYENILMEASCEDAAQIDFTDEGSVFASGVSGDYALTMVCNEGYNTLPWHQTTVSGSDSNTISMQQTADGIIISGDLSNVNVTATEHDTEYTLDFSTNDSSVLLTEKTVGSQQVPVIKLDSDGDGVYEQTYGEQQSPTPTAPPVQPILRFENFATTVGAFNDIAYYAREARAGDVVTLKVSLSELGEKYGLDYHKLSVTYETEGALQQGESYDYFGNPVYKDGIATDFVLGKGLNKITAHVSYAGVSCGTFEPFWVYIS